VELFRPFMEAMQEVGDGRKRDSTQTQT
jgi:hypothetical protein